MSKPRLSKAETRILEQCWKLGTCSVRTAEAGMAGCKWAIGWHNYLRTPDKASHPYADGAA